MTIKRDTEKTGKTEITICKLHESIDLGKKNSETASMSTLLFGPLLGVVVGIK